MSDIDEYGARIAAALDQISSGLQELSRPAPAPAPEAAPVDTSVEEALRAQLEEERSANAQLEARVEALGERQDTRIAALEKDLSTERARLAELDSQLQGLRQTSADLRDVSAQMRRAIEGQVAEADLINRAALAELDALKAERDADRAEVSAILAELTPIIEEAS